MGFYSESCTLQVKVSRISENQTTGIMLKEFKEFALKGNVVDMAVGIIIGGAFGALVNSLVNDVMMPPLGLFLKGVDFSNLFVVLRDGSKPAPYLALADAKAVGAVTLNYGLFINALIGFLIMAFAVFLLVRSINRLRSISEKPAASAVAAVPQTKECPYCFSTIPVKAVRCPNCTSQL
jgi:large conductance mechanosensitive channel